MGSLDGVMFKLGSYTVSDGRSIEHLENVWNQFVSLCYTAIRDQVIWGISPE